MSQTVYVDVLVIINIYINYALLLLTCFVRKYNPDRLRLLMSSLFGGLYSLIILVPDISETAVSLSRIPALVIMVYLAFGYGGVRKFLKQIFAFLGINLVFAGAMFLLWLLAAPENMYFNSGVVYFGIDALTLVLLTIGAYVLIRLVALFTKSRIPQNFIYDVSIFLSGKEHKCRGFYDSGNSLCDPFSGEGVVIVDINVVKETVGEDMFEKFESAQGDIRMKLIPVKSLSGEKLLPSFRVEKIIIKGIENNISLEKPIIALCKEKIHGGDYGALLYSSVFDNDTIEGKGENLCFTYLKKS